MPGTQGERAPDIIGKLTEAQIVELKWGSQFCFAIVDVHVCVTRSNHGAKAGPETYIEK